MSSVPAIEVKNLTVVYNEGTPNEVVAFENFSMSIAAKEVVVITGDNGSGKSTLLNVIAGNVPIKSGSILFHGIDVARWSISRRARTIGFVHQDTMLGTCPNLTIDENIKLIISKTWWSLLPYIIGQKKKQYSNISLADSLCKNRPTTKINNLSGGQRQGFSIHLRQIQHNPILLLDEFTSALSKTNKHDTIHQLFEYLNTEKITALVVLHDHRIINSNNVRLINLSNDDEQ